MAKIIHLSQYITKKHKEATIQAVAKETHFATNDGLKKPVRFRRHFRLFDFF